MPENENKVEALHINRIITSRALQCIGPSDYSSQSDSKLNQYMCSYFPPLTNWEPSYKVSA